MRLLLIEDNYRLNESLKLSLIEEGYAVDSVYDGQSGEEYAEAAPYDAIILDVMLPRKDGLEVCRELRHRRLKTPIIMLTARDTVEDRVQGLDSGADDYLVKPFAMNELCARLRALLRRDTSDKSSALYVGDLLLDPVTRQVSRGELQFEFAPKEYAILEYFMRNPNRVITREMAIQHVWNYDFEGISNIIDVYVRRLRRKIDDPFEEKLFETVHGVGYRLHDPNLA